MCAALLVATCQGHIQANPRPGCYCCGDRAASRAQAVWQPLVSLLQVLRWQKLHLLLHALAVRLMLQWLWLLRFMSTVN